MFEIEKNVPRAGYTGGMGAPAKYPWLEMNVGESFFVPNVTVYKMSPSAAGFSRRHPGFKFTCRGVEGGVRVWRVS